MRVIKGDLKGFLLLKYGAVDLPVVVIYLRPQDHLESQLVTGCNPNDLDIWTDWWRLGLQFIVYKSAEQEWSFIN